MHRSDDRPERPADTDRERAESLLGSADKDRESAAAESESADADPGRVSAADDRRPRSVYGVGREPEVQGSLANQRTALAWVRTGLALVAGGVALTTVASAGDFSALLDFAAVAACLGGGALALAALASWRANERALRLDEPLPRPVALPWLVGGVVVVGVVLAANAVLELMRRG